MAWIESHLNISHHPKTLRLASLTGWSLNETVGVLHRLWHWTLAYAEDGDLSKYNPKEVGLALNLSETLDFKDNNLFFELLIKCGFMDEDEKIHDWLDYAGRYLKAKYQTHNPGKLLKIQEKYNSSSKVSPKSDFSETPLPTLTNLNTPKKKPKKVAKATLKDSIKEFKQNFQDSNTFTTAWAEWIAHRKDIKKPLTERSAKMQAKRLSELSITEAVAIIEKSIECGWMGLFPPKKQSVQKLSEAGQAAVESCKQVFGDEVFDD